MVKPTLSRPVLVDGHCLEYDQISRRAFLQQGLSSLIRGYPASAFPRIRLAKPHVGPRGDTLVCIFLRGGADGLNIVVPHGDDDYHRARPFLGIARPDDKAEFKVVDLDGFFGLHPALQPLKEIYAAGDMAFVHAAGSPDETRSHFEAMALMERGVTTNDYDGWLTRHLTTLDTENVSALRAVGIGDMLPASLTGTVKATALESIAAHHLAGSEASRQSLQRMLSTLYNQQSSLLTESAAQTFAAIDVLNKIDIDAVPSGRDYPDGQFGFAMRTVAQLLHADVGMEVACIDLGGWDTHAAQGGGQGQMARLMEQLAGGLSAFYEDVNLLMGDITVVVMSEFGRRVKENASLGTDHGHGNMMMVIGGGIEGEKVFANWPGLHEEQRVGPGDLAITIDYRDVLGEILSKRLNNPQPELVFPNYTIIERGIAQAR